jgi:hypothetical protein
VVAPRLVGSTPAPLRSRNPCKRCTSRRVMGFSSCLETCRSRRPEAVRPVASVGRLVRCSAQAVWPMVEPFSGRVAGGRGRRPVHPRPPGVGDREHGGTQSGRNLRAPPGLEGRAGQPAKCQRKRVNSNSRVRTGRGGINWHPAGLALESKLITIERHGSVEIGHEQNRAAGIGSVSHDRRGRRLAQSPIRAVLAHPAGSARDAESRRPAKLGG